MARFPRTEAEVIALAEAMITGLTSNAVLYPAPPVAVLDLTAAKAAYTTALNAMRERYMKQLQKAAGVGGVTGTLAAIIIVLIEFFSRR